MLTTSTCIVQADRIETIKGWEYEKFNGTIWEICKANVDCTGLVVDTRFGEYGAFR